GSATLVQKFRRSVAVAAPIEQVVDPHLHHLNVAVALGESVAGEEWGDPSRNNKGPIIQPKIIILDLCRPIGRESPLDARAHQPAAVGVVVGGGDRCAGRQIGDGEVKSKIKTKLVTFVTDNVLLVGIVGNKNLLARMLQDKERQGRSEVGNMSKGKESSHEKVRSMPWKAGIRYPLP